jgi:hypothetical protein
VLKPFRLFPGGGGVTIPAATPTELVTPGASDQQITIQNTDGNTVYLGTDNTVSSTNCVMQLYSGQAVPMYVGKLTGLWGYSVGGTTSLAVLVTVSK